MLIISERIEKELDGLFSTEKEVVLTKNNSKIKIPQNSFIIVEVKNHNKYSDITKNIIEKRNLLSKLGIDVMCLYFIGILKEYDSLKYFKNDGALLKKICYLL